MPANTGQKALSVAKEVSFEAGEVVLGQFRKINWVRSKGSDAKDLVTSADLASQKLVFKRLREEFPDYGIYGEESLELRDSSIGSGKFTWVVDPLDATVNFTAGLPLWCVSIALVDSQMRPVASVVNSPALGELFWAARGKGACLNGKRMSIGKAPLHQSVVSVSVSHLPERGKRALALMNLLSPSIGWVRSIGCSSLELAYTACGRFGACVNFSSADWDVLPGSLLVEEAGGSVRGAAGERKLTPSTGFAAGAPGILDGVLAFSSRV